MLTVGGLFSGIGGFELGLVRAGFQIKWMVEIDEFCQKVLKKHAPEYWPNARILSNVKEVGKHNLEPVDVICGGFPCQPFSNAGERRGKEDDRYLWPEMLRIISELKPKFIIGENVTGFINMELENSLIDLEAEGYKVEAFVLPACAVGLPHERKRIWILAYPNSINGEKELGFHDEHPREILEGSNRHRSESYTQTIPGINGVADGVPNRVDRLRALGNAVVPQIPEIIGKFILQVTLC